MDADVIISMCAPTPACYVTAEVAMRTCAAHTDANIIVVANNMPVPQYKDALFENAQALGVKWYPYDHTPLNIAKLFNEVVRSTSGKFYVMCQQDVIFYEHWLANLIAAWEAEPDYFVLSPWSFNLHRKDFSCDLIQHPRSGIVEAWPHGTAGIAFRRARPWFYAEDIPTASDSDLYHDCKANKWRTGIVPNSRVDHLGSVVLSELGNWDAIMNNPTQGVDDSRRLKEKWNL